MIQSSRSKIAKKETEVNFKWKYTMYVIICKQMLTVANAPYTGLCGTRIRLLSSQYNVSCIILWLPKIIMITSVISMCYVMSKLTSASTARCVGILEPSDLDLWPMTLIKGLWREDENLLLRSIPTCCYSIFTSKHSLDDLLLYYEISTFAVHFL